jgi:hypothetical protein
MFHLLKMIVDVDIVTGERVMERALHHEDGLGGLDLGVGVHDLDIGRPYMVPPRLLPSLLFRLCHLQWVWPLLRVVGGVCPWRRFSALVDAVRVLCYSRDPK